MKKYYNYHHLIAQNNDNYDEILKKRIADSIKLPITDLNNEPFFFNSFPEFSIIADFYHNDMAINYQNFKLDELLNEIILNESYANLNLEGINCSIKEIADLIKEVNYEQNNYNIELKPDNIDKDGNVTKQKNMIRAISYMIQNKDSAINVEKINKIYDILTKKTELEIINQNEIYRSSDIEIVNYFGEVTNSGVPHDFIFKKMQELITFINDDQDQIAPTTKMQLIHVLFFWIQPYYYYDGVIARIISLWYALKHNLMLVHNALYIRRYRQEYSEALKYCFNEKPQRDLTFFLIYIYEIWQKENKANQLFQKVQAKYPLPFNLTEKEIIKALAKNNVLGTQKINETINFDWSQQRINKSLISLEKAKIIKSFKRQDKKAKIYEINQNFLGDNSAS